MKMLFNRRPLIEGGRIEQPPTDLVKNTPSLWQADLDTAIMYGGELTRAALGAMDIRGDKKYVLVDTKVHMLMPGQCPAIPGWHTDGVPRLGPDGKYSPVAPGPPDIFEQDRWDYLGDRPRFHLLVTGEGCLTEFLDDQLLFEVPDEPTSELYAMLTHQINELKPRKSFVDSCCAYEWDWWNLHQGILATKREFRFLIRVTESDYHEPQPRVNLAEIIRTQQMVYTPMEFGW